MDIDAFLDEELHALSKGEAAQKIAAVKNEQPLPPDPDIKADEDIGDIETSSAPLEQNEQGLHELEQTYIEMWKRIAEKPYEWDQKLYTQLEATHQSSAKAYEGLAAEVSRKKRTAQKIAQEIGDALRNHDVAGATKLYEQLVEIRDDIPSLFVEERQALSERLLELHQRLTYGINARYLHHFRSTIKETHLHISKALMSVKSSMVHDAKEHYDQAITLFLNLPSGFVRDKLRIGHLLRELYKNLTIKLQMNDLQQHLSTSKIDTLTQHPSHASLQRLSDIVHAQVKRHPLKKHADTEIDSMQGRSSPSSRPSSKRAATFSSSTNLPPGLLDRIIARKLERAQSNLRKGFHSGARKNIDSVLRMDPDNKKAQELLRKIG